MHMQPAVLHSFGRVGTFGQHVCAEVLAAEAGMQVPIKLRRKTATVMVASPNLVLAFTVASRCSRLHVWHQDSTRRKFRCFNDLTEKAFIFNRADSPKLRLLAFFPQLLTRLLPRIGECACKESRP
jgi:hypothetical protein